MTRAVRHELERGELADLLAELHTELGPPDEAMMADAKALFDAVEGTESKRRTRSGHRR